MDLYPEANENERECIYTQLSYHILLGQTEMVASIVKVALSAINNQVDTSTTGYKVIEDVVSYPFCIRGSSLSDDDLYARTSSLLSVLIRNKTEKYSKFVSEFDNSSCLKEISQFVSDNEILKELLTCLSSVSHRDVSSAALDILNLSTSALSTLQALLSTCPASGHALIRHLTRPFTTEHHQACILPLHRLYIPALITTLTATTDHLLFHQLFIIFDPPASIQMTSDDLQSLFIAIYDLLSSSIDYTAELSQVLALCLSKRWSGLQQFGSYCDSRALPQCTAELPMSVVETTLFHQLTSNVSSDVVETDSFWKLACLQLASSPGRQIIDDVIRLAVRLMEHRRWDKLSLLVNCRSVFARLGPVLLLSLWPLCENLTDADQLISICFTPNEENDVNNELLQLSHKIKSHFQLVKSVVDFFSSSLDAHPDLSQTFSSVGNCSNLRIISSAFSLTHIDPSIVDQFFQKLAPTNEDDIKLARICDKSLFTAFSILKLGIECIRLFRTHTTDDDVEGPQDDFLFAYNFNEALASGNSSRAQKLYEQSILSRLTRISELLNGLKPLSLRLEVIENLYSLIFATVDMLETRRPNSDQSSDDSATTKPPVLGTLGAELSATNLSEGSQSQYTEDTEGRSRNYPGRYFTKKEKKCPLGYVQFQCPAYLVRDLVLTCKAALEQVQMCRTQLKTRSLATESSRTEDQTVAGLMGLPVWDQIGTRADRLGESLAEAMWRFQLLTSSKFPTTLGALPSREDIGDAGTEHSIDMSYLKDRTKRRSTGNMSCRSADGSEKDSCGHTPEQSKKIAAQLRRMRSCSRANAGQTDTLRLMMSDADSIIAHCLLRDDFGRALDVVKIFSSSPTEPLLAGEARFCAQLHTAFSKLSTLVRPTSPPPLAPSPCNTPPVSRPQSPPHSSLDDLMDGSKGFGRGSLSAIRKVAAASTSASNAVSMVTKIVDDLMGLGGEFRPPSLLADLDLTQDQASEAMQRQNAAIIFDLACSGSRTLDHLRTLLNLSLQRLPRNPAPLCGDLQPEENDDTTSGRLKTMAICIKYLITLIEAESSLLADSGGSTTHSCLTPSWSKAPYLLNLYLKCPGKAELKALAGHIQTTAERIHEAKEIALANRNEAVGLFSPSSHASLASLPERGSSLKSAPSGDNGGRSTPLGASLSLRTTPDSRQSPTFLNQRPQMICSEKFMHLLQIIDNIGPRGKSIPNIINMSSEMKSYRYLNALLEHITLFSRFLKEQEQDEAAGKGDDELDDETFQVLNNSPAKVIGQLIFEKWAEPIRLEKICHDLGLSVSHVILQSCCPEVPTKDVVVKAIQIPDCPSRKVYNVKLEDLENHNYPELQHQLSPNGVAVELLIVILNTIEQLSSGSPSPISDPHTLMLHLVQDPRVKVWQTSDVTRLASVDLRMLETVQQKMAFYLNLHNIMMVHLLLTLTQSGETTFSAKDFQSFLKRKMFCYRIGQLGTVSIHEIRSQYLKLPERNFLDQMSKRKNDESFSSPVQIESRYTLNTTSGNQMLLFGLLDGTCSSVPLKIYSDSTVLSELDKNLSLWMSQCLETHQTSGHIELPVLLDTYSSLLTPRDQEDLITYLLSHCSVELQNSATALTKHEDHQSSNSSDGTASSVRWIPQDSRIFLPTVAMATLPPAPTTPNMDSDVPLYLHPDANISSNTQHFSPTTPAVDFLFGSSPLLATLALLVCGDNIVHPPAEHTLLAEPDEDTKAAQEAQEVAVMVNYRSYRYTRLSTEFQALGQWVKRYWTRLGLCGTGNRDLKTDMLLKFCTDVPPQRIRWNLISHATSPQLLADISTHLLSLFHYSRWDTLAEAILSLPPVTRLALPLANHLLDYALHCQLASPPSRLEMARRLSCLHSLTSAYTRAGLVMACLPYLPAGDACQLLERCVRERAKIGQTPGDIEFYLPRMRVFSQIAHLIASKEAPLSRSSLPAEFTLWPRLEEASISRPSHVLTILLWWKTFALAKQWALIYMPDTGLQKIEAAYLNSLVENDNLVNSVLFIKHLFSLMQSEMSVTSSASDIQFVLQVCLEVIDYPQSCPLAVQLASGFALRYLSPAPQEDLRNITSKSNGRTQQQVYNNESDSSGEDNQSETTEKEDSTNEIPLLLTRAYVGSSMVRALPVSVQRDYYIHLMSKPELILEQLMMNMQVESCKRLLDAHHLQRSHIHHCDPDLHSPPISINSSSPSTTAKSSSLATALPLARLPELEPAAISDLLIRYAGKAVSLGDMGPRSESQNGDVTVDFAYMTMRSVSQRRKSVQSMDDILSTTSPTLYSPSVDGEDIFIMPDEPPPRDKWIPDDKATVCMCCKMERFSMFNRRHHCRRCGRVVCASCSSHQAVVHGVSSRVCSQCHSILTAQDSNLEISSGIPNMGSRSRDNSTIGGLGASSGRNRAGTVMVGFIDEGWRLSRDEQENSQIRQDFSYEQTPSLTLCLSLLDLHPNSNDCGYSILDICDYLSSFLTPGPDNRPNPEVDYPLVISIIRNLLYKAKLKFSRVSNSEATLRCDVYMSHLDLLHILVQSNYRRLPSLNQLTRKDQVVAFRDRLIQSERLELAMEVSTKAGLSCTAVWSAMALRSLERGDYTEARTFMARFQKPVQDKNSLNPLQPPLSDVIKLLEGRRPSGVLISDILGIVEGINNLLDEPEKKVRADIGMSREALEECIFYLEKYGSHLHYLQFLVRHNIWMKAVKYARETKVSSEVFVEGLVSPALSTGKFTTLRDQMLMLDDTLASWAPYMDRICHYLDRTGHVTDLYNIQVLSKDYVRAAITCIYSFFLRNATSYTELASRLPHLHTASQHLENALRSAITSAPGTPGQQQPARANTQSQEIQRYQTVVKMQEDAIRFLNQPACIKHMSSSPTAYKPKDLPTLFSKDANSKVEFCLVVIFSSAVLLDGLTMAGKMMKECRMKPVPIVIRAGYHLQTQLRLGHQNCEAALRELVREMRNVCYMDNESADEILLALLKRMTDTERKGKTSAELVKLVNSRENKIEANLLTEQFLTAYRYAAQAQPCNLEEIAKIGDLAQKAGNTQAAEICKKKIKEDTQSL